MKSHHAELWLRLVPTPKLVDKIRPVWGYRGLLVKFKLEVGVSDDELISAAEHARAHSGADLVVANTLEGMQDWAYIGAGDAYRRVAREVLPTRLMETVEKAVAARAERV